MVSLEHGLVYPQQQKRRQSTWAQMQIMQEATDLGAAGSSLLCDSIFSMR